MPTSRLYLIALTTTLLASGVHAQALTYALAGGNEGWPGWARDAVVQSMDEAVATYERYGHFEKHITANYNAGVPTAQGNYSGWLDFGGSHNTRVALHEIAHALGIGTYWAFNGGAWAEDSAAGRLIKLYEGQGAVLSTGGSHFWPYGLNYDNEDGPAARERHCKLVAAFRFDMGIVQDSDADSLPDDWETFHFATLAESGAGDPDGDGISNQHEYATDSDPTEAAPVVDGHTYVLRSQISGRALSVTAASHEDAAGTEQREPDGGRWQAWTAHYLGDGFFRFTNVESGKVLAVPGSDTASGLPVQQVSWTGSLEQQWRITSGPGAEDGYYQIANRETARVVDGLDGAEGAPVQQYPFIGAIPQQFWSFEDVTPGLGLPDAGEPEDGGAAAAGDGGTFDPDLGSPLEPRDGSVAGPDAGVSARPTAPGRDEGTTPPGSSGCALALPRAADLRASLILVVLTLACMLRRARRQERV